MKIKELSQQTNEELVKVVADSRAALAKFAVEVRTGKVDNIKSAKAYRLTMARALTIMREREITEQEQVNGTATMSERSESNG